MRIKTIFFSVIFSLQCLTGYSYQADVKYIPSQEYGNTAVTEIENAKSSIKVYMYLVSVFMDQPNSLTMKLIQSLIKAKERGVDVLVVLDQNISFEDESRQDASFQSKNQNAYEILKRADIKVFFDEAQVYTHAKTIIIDDEIVILGSTNWSKAALTRNNEANAIIRSKEFAQECLADLEARVKLQEAPLRATGSVTIPSQFVRNERSLGTMATARDERSLDAYLYLLSQFTGAEGSKVTLNYDALAESLGIKSMPREDYRRQINKVLSKLRDKYKLIEFKAPERSENSEVTLKDPGDLRKAYTTPEKEFFDVSADYWKYGWNQKLKFPAKVMFLILNSYASPSNPSFFISRQTLSKRHGISESFISDGTQELRRLNLLTIQYGKLENQNFSRRDANTYTPKPLYDPETVKRQIATLEGKYGKEKLGVALKAAAVFFEENDPTTIESLLELRVRASAEIFNTALTDVEKKSIDNPKRTAGYFMTVVERLSKSSGLSKNSG